MSVKSYGPTLGLAIPPPTPSDRSDKSQFTRAAWSAKSPLSPKIYPKHLYFTYVPIQKQNDILEALDLILSIQPHQRYKVFTTRFFRTQVQIIMPKLFRYELQMIARSPAVCAAGFSREKDDSCFEESSPVQSNSPSNNANINNNNTNPPFSPSSKKQDIKKYI
eukprot:UN01365